MFQTVAIDIFCIRYQVLIQLIHTKYNTVDLIFQQAEKLVLLGCLLVLFKSVS